MIKPSLSVVSSANQCLCEPREGHDKSRRGVGVMTAAGTGKAGRGGIRGGLNVD